MTAAFDRGRHPEAGTLASFAEGNLRSAQRAAVIEHLDGCEDCLSEVALAMRAAPQTRSAWTPGRIAAAAAAALLLVLWPLLWWRRAEAHEPIARLVAAAPRAERRVEPRLTGGFAWARYRGGERAAASEPDAVQMKLTGIAGELVEEARDGTAESRHAAAVALVLAQQPQAAAAQLDAVPRGSRDAKAWSDLAAARYALAADRRRPSLYPEALAAADEALRIDPELPEALFNRALILERLQLTAEARKAWERYLAIDASSPWAEEARARLRELSAAPSSSRFERDRPLFERAAAGGDVDAVRKWLAVHAARARAFAETEYLAEWGEAELRGDAQAERWLTMARTTGIALAETMGEHLLRDSVAAIEVTHGATRRSVAEAHALYRRARRAYSADAAVAARPQLLRAAALLERGGDPLSLMARHYAASALLASHDREAARGELETLVALADRHAHYIALRAHVRWELARTFALDDDPATAARILTQGAALFRRGGDEVGAAFMESMLASALTAAGRGDEAWEARIRAFASLGREGDHRLLTASLAAAKRSEWLAGRSEAALALARLDALRDRTGVRPVDLADSLVYRAMLESAAGNDAESLAAAREAADVAAAVADPAVRSRLEADASVATGAAMAASDPRTALAALTRAIDVYRKHDLVLSLPEPLLLRARCALRTGDAAAAWRDLDEGMALVERHRRDDAAAAFGSGALEVTEALFTDAIALALARGDDAGAFATAERSRGAALTLPELQRRLAGSGTVVLEAVALPREAVTFAVSERETIVSRHPEPRNAVAALARSSVTENDPAAAAALYDALIRPAEPLLARARQLIVVPDAVLDAVPFGALYDRTARRYLVERMPVAIAASAASLAPASLPSGSRTLSVAAVFAGGDASQQGVPAAMDEIRDVLARYPRTVAIPRTGGTLESLRALDADVLHIAGHTSEEGSGGSRVLLLSTPDGTEKVWWPAIAAARPLAARVVVLAACETLRRPDSRLTRTPSLGAAFSAAGADDVVGTLAKIADRDARQLFDAIHRELASGAAPAEAVQAVQKRAIAVHGPPVWRAVTVLTRRIPVPR